MERLDSPQSFFFEYARIAFAILGGSCLHEEKIRPHPRPGSALQPQKLFHAAESRVLVELRAGFLENREEAFHEGFRLLVLLFRAGIVERVQNQIGERRDVALRGFFRHRFPRFVCESRKVEFQSVVLGEGNHPVD